MVRFLTTTGVSYQLEEVIKNARERLVIISPYLKINRRIRDLLEDQDRLKRDIRIVYRNRELQPEETEWLGSTSIRTSYCESLHAKCYMNEQIALITSMNLYEYSQVNNDEMGILISAQDDPDVYREIKEEADRIVRTGEEIRVTVAKVISSDAPDPNPRARHETPVSTMPTTGFCIRCGESIDADPSKPYCYRDYQIWKRYANEAYEENHCHICVASHSKQLCSSHYVVTARESTHSRLMPFRFSRVST